MSNAKRHTTAYTWLRVSLREARSAVPRINIWMSSMLASHQRVPVLRQTSAVDCGAACLAMILSFYGRKTSVSECRERIDVGRDGMTARTIAKAAQAYGLRVRAFSLEPHQLKDVQLPAIIHWNFNHFVVVESWSQQNAKIIDPAFGRRWLTTQEFSEHFTGIALTFEPGEGFEQRRKTADPFWLTYLSDMVRAPGNREVLAQILVVSLILQLVGLALPLFTKLAVDYLLPYQISSLMAMLALGVALVAVTQFVTSYLRGVLLLQLQGRLDSRLMIGFFDHVLALPYRFFEQRSSGDLLMRLESNMIIREILTSQTLSIVLDGSLVVIYLAILSLRAPVFGALALGIGLLQIALVLGTSRRMHMLMQRYVQAQVESQSYLIEALNGIGMLKASGAEAQVLNHWSKLYLHGLNLSLQRNHLTTVIESGLAMLRMLGPLALLWYGAYQVLHGTMDLGTMLALNVLASAFLVPLTTLTMRGQQLQTAATHLERIADVVRAEPEQDVRHVQPVLRISGQIDVRDVSFRYHPQAPVVLQQASISIASGQKVALVGRTGSGKSTLIKLLLGLYVPTEGAVFYDGVPVQQLNLRMLRNQFGTVLQESFLFSGSIRQNIAFNDPQLSLEAVMVAAQLAAVHDEIMQFPMGYETIIGEGGHNLSGGQRQRLSLARALAHQPAVLILDEATSHLDVLTEAIVDQYLNELACTRIVIAHRLSTVRNADLILVLDHGAIVERGTHEELVAQNGHYAALIQHQLLSERAPAEEHAA